MKLISRMRLVSAISVACLSLASMSALGKPPFSTPPTATPPAPRPPVVVPPPFSGSVSGEELFQHVATFDVINGGNPTAVAEIIDASADGTLLAYTDAETKQVGFVDILDPGNPLALGAVPVGGEPTSLVWAGDYVLVAVNTSADFVNPSGKLVVIVDPGIPTTVELELGGQPDSIAIAPDGRSAVVVLENERDEDLNDGLIPQNDSGEVLIVDLSDLPNLNAADIQAVDLSAVAADAFAGDDLEPEYVDINNQNLAVVSFQENNHFAVINIRSGKVIKHFPAGTVDLSNVDTEEEDLIKLDSTLTRRREPDAVTWIDNNSFVSANEGDYEDGFGIEGGSRGFTLFDFNGNVEYESAESFEHWLVSVGHYNESRSENKGVEPEAVEFGKFGDDSFLFVGSERSNAVGVYNVSKGFVQPLQILPTGVGPEGLKAIPQQQLFVASTEEFELAGAGIPSMINIYRQGGSSYPTIQSDLEAGLPIPWVALSGLVGDSSNADILYAVSDSFLAQGFIYTINVAQEPALIVARRQIVDGTDNPLAAVINAYNGPAASGNPAGQIGDDRLDPEGIAVGPDGFFWIASEGRFVAGGDGDPDEYRPNLVLKVDPATGEIVQVIELPVELVTDPTGEFSLRSNGFEGIAVSGDAGAESVYVAIQRAWPAEGDSDKLNTKIGRYDVSSDEWTFVHYPLEVEGNGGWIGLSDLTLLPNGDFAVIERDKGWGMTTAPIAELKKVFTVDLAAAPFSSYVDGAAGGGLATLAVKTELYDLLPYLETMSIFTAEKLEGFAVAADHQVYAVTDNDGVDDAPGETVFMRLGELAAEE